MTDETATQEPQEDVQAPAGGPQGQPEPDDLAGVPPERLAAMLRDKRKAEASLRERLRAAEAERDSLRTARDEATAAVLAATRQDAVAAAAKELRADADLLMDSRTFTAALEGLDAAAGDYGDQVAALVKRTVQDAPAFLQRPVATRSSNPPEQSGWPGESYFDHHPTTTWGDVLGGA